MYQQTCQQQLTDSRRDAVEILTYGLAITYEYWWENLVTFRALKPQCLTLSTGYNPTTVPLLP